MPNGYSALFSTEHYILPLIIALGVSGIARKKNSDCARQFNLFGSLRLVVAFALIIYLHFNLKLWAQIINPVRWDSYYEYIDQLLWPATFILHSFYPFWFEFVLNWPHAYHDLFVLMFIISLVGHASFSPNRGSLSEVATAIALVLVIGGFSYSIAPAWGPFIFESGTNPIATHIQREMAAFQFNFTGSAGGQYQGENFIMALGAMPSLHSGHAFVLLFYAWRSVRWLGYIYLLIFVFIINEAILAKWHYVIDIPFGLLVAALSILLANRFHKPESVVIKVKNHAITHKSDHPSAVTP